MLKCKNCGSEMQDEDIFCGYCGTRADGKSISETQPHQEQGATMRPQPTPDYAQTPGPTPMQPVVLKKITLRSPTGELKSIRVGFSWTTFFFGPWVCIFRKDWLFGIIWLVVAWGGLDFIYGFAAGMTGGLVESGGGAFNYEETLVIFGSVIGVLFLFYLIIGVAFQIVMAFKYNRMYIKKLLAKGWQPYSSDDANTLRQKKIWNIQL